MAVHPLVLHRRLKKQLYKYLCAVFAPLPYTLRATTDTTEKALDKAFVNGMLYAKRFIASDDDPATCIIDINAAIKEFKKANK